MLTFRTFPLRVLAAAAALGTVAATSPARAQSANVFTGSVQVDCFGCGIESPGDADLSFVIYGDVHANLRVRTLGGAVCTVYSEWDGDMVGGRVLTFRMTVVGAAFVLTGFDPANDVYAGGGMLSGSGVTCGAPAQFTIIGAFAGT